MLPTIVRILCVIVFLAASGRLAHGAPTNPERLQYRWVYVRSRLADDAFVPIAQEVMQRAKKAGYNGVVLEDEGFHKLEQMNEQYFANAETVRATAEGLGLAIYPIVFNKGELELNPNLAEGLPVRKAHYLAGDSRARLVPSPDLRLINGNFERARTNRFEGWATQTAPGISTFNDDFVYHRDGRSLRMENFRAGEPKFGAVEISQPLTLVPYHQYRISLWVKTENLNPQARLEIEVHGLKEQTLLWPGHRLDPSQDWQPIFAVFNSLNNIKANLRISMLNANGGKIWLDDAAIEEAGLLNVLRREGCPLVVENAPVDEATKPTFFKENEDFQPVKDDELGDSAHTAPLIHLVPGSHIRDGENLYVSYYHAMNIEGSPAGLCLSCPETDALLKTTAEHVNALLQPKGFFLNLRDVRSANWCLLCTNRHLAPTALLGELLNRCEATLRKENPKARLFVWSDMFDPNQSAKDPYYLVAGGWKNSWKSLPKDMAVVNWNGLNPDSLSWFSRHDTDQILAGYLDGSPGDIQAWLAQAGNSSRVIGVMYTTWQNKYDALEAFGKADWGGKK